MFYSKQSHIIIYIIWYQINKKFEHLSWNNPSVCYTWQHSHRDRICTTLFWPLSWSIFPQHSSNMFDFKRRAIVYLIIIDRCCFLLYRYFRGKRPPLLFNYNVNSLYCSPEQLLEGFCWDIWNCDDVIIISQGSTQHGTEYSITWDHHILVNRKWHVTAI